MEELEQETVSTEATADPLSLLLAAGTKADAVATAHVASPMQQHAVPSAKSDLLTLLALDLSKKHDQLGSTPAKPDAVKQLDELFTDFGVVTAK